MSSPSDLPLRPMSPLRASLPASPTTSSAAALFSLTASSPSCGSSSADHAPHRRVASLSQEAFDSKAEEKLATAARVADPNSATQLLPTYAAVCTMVVACGFAASGDPRLESAESAKQYRWAAAGSVRGVAVALALFVLTIATSLWRRDARVAYRSVRFFQVAVTAGVAYAMWLAFMMQHDLPSVRAIIRWADPSVHSPLPQKDYATDCRLSTPDDPFKFFHTVFDVYLLSHTLGYFFMMLALGDWRLTTAVSIAFEIIEVSGQHLLPNFKECWWDHVIVDMFVCNALGTFTGYLWIRAFDWPRLVPWITANYSASMQQQQQESLSTTGYDQPPRDGEEVVSSAAETARTAKRLHNEEGNQQRLIQQNKDAERLLLPLDWNIFASFSRYFLTPFIVFLVMSVEETLGIVLMKTMWLSPPHKFNVLRKLLWAIMGGACTRDLYAYSQGVPYSKGTIAVTFMVIALETGFSAKLIFEGTFYRDAWPCYITVPWIIALCGFASWMALHFGTLAWRRSAVRQRPFAVKAVSYLAHALLASVGITFLVMSGMANVDLQWGRPEC